MADIGDIQIDAEGRLGPPGQPYRLGARGWVPIEQQDLERLTKGPVGRFGAGFLGGATDTPAGAAGRLADVFGLGLGGAQIGKAIASSAARRVFGGTASRVQQALREGVTERAAARQRQQLGGSLQTVPERGSIAPTGDHHLLRQLGGDSTEQNIASMQQQLRSVGAAEVDTARLSVVDLFTAPADLTAAQQKAIPFAERLGFKFLPGQVQGSKLFLEGIKSDPILRGAVEWELAHNRVGLQQSAARALGLSDDIIFDADAMGLVADVLGEGFEGIADDIGALTLPGNLVDDIVPLLSPNQRRVWGMAAKNNSPVGLETGREVMQIRSRLMRQATDEFRGGRSVVADDINEMVAALDELIDAVISPGTKRMWARLREQWRIFRVLEKPNVVDLDTGNINFITARNNLRNEFKGEFGRQAFSGTGQRRGRISPHTSNFMDWVRVSAAFKDAVGDSGTATRLLSVQNLTNPKETAKKYLARRLIQREADRLNLPAEP